MGFNVPMIVLGGGGYTIENVARCWTYQTSVLLNQDIGNDIPEYNEFYSYYKDDNYKIHFEPKKLYQNMNSRKDLDRLIQIIA
jgi:acetoin utilization deacetylase AcuC-like enzyme